MCDVSTSRRHAVTILAGQPPVQTSSLTVAPGMRRKLAAMSEAQKSPSRTSGRFIAGELAVEDAEGFASAYRVREALADQ